MADHHSMYLKLTAVMIVLALFGLGLSLANAHRLLCIGRGIWKPKSPAGNTVAASGPGNGGGNGSTFASKVDPRTIHVGPLRALYFQKKVILQMITGFQASFAALSLYSAIVLFPLRFASLQKYYFGICILCLLRLWYIRSYTVCF